MKSKVIAVVGALALALGAAGCGSDSGTGEPAATGEPSAAVTTEASQPTDQAPEESEPTEESPAGDYVVTIDDWKKAKDYKKNAAIVVDFTFTNNSDDAANFLFAVSAKAFQNGVELERAMIMDDDKYDAANSMKDIKPGATIKVQEAYLLDDKSDVTVEVTELISFDDTMIATKVISLK